MVLFIRGNYWYVLSILPKYQKSSAILNYTTICACCAFQVTVYDCTAVKSVWCGKCVWVAKCSRLGVLSHYNFKYMKFVHCNSWEGVHGWMVVADCVVRMESIGQMLFWLVCLLRSIATHLTQFQTFACEYMHIVVKQCVIPSLSICFCRKPFHRSYICTVHMCNWPVIGALKCSTVILQNHNEGRTNVHSGPIPCIDVTVHG